MSRAALRCLESICTNTFSARRGASAKAATGYSTTRATWILTTTRLGQTAGINHISNRILLCGPCNRLKSNTLTLTGLRRKNKKLGYMHASSTENPVMKEIREAKKKAPPLFE